MPAKHGRKAPQKPPRRGPLDTVAFSTALFVCPDAYADVPGSIIDTVAKGVKTIGVLFTVTVQNVTAKVQGSLNGTTWHDCTTADQIGVARPIDVPVVAGTPLAAIISPFLAAGAAAGAHRFYKAQAKNTVGAVIGSIVVTVVGKQ